MSMDWILVGNRIQKRRKECHWTQEQLAEKLSVTVGYVSQMERGTTKINLEMLSEIGTLLDCDISYFLTGTIKEKETYLQDEFLSKYVQLDQSYKKMFMEILEIFLRDQNSNNRNIK